MKTTGWPPSRLMQDDCRKLSRWLADTPHARSHAKEAADEIQRNREMTMDEISNEEKLRLQNLAYYATRCLLSETLVEMIHPPSWKREGFPLPVKKMLPGYDGSTRQEYRPMAVLEYVHEVLTGEVAARNARDRKAMEKAQAATS